MIELKDLTKNFDNKEVLRGLNLEVKEGETLVIIGRSGCGKSVTLKHIMGIMRPDAGEVLFEGKDIFNMRHSDLEKYRLKFGYVFQGAALFDSLTVHDNVGFSLIEHSDLSKEEINRRVTETLELVGLHGIENLMPAELSGGMKKRVGIARAICMKPEIVLYDEPTTGVDPIMADAVNEMINDLHSRLRVTSIVVTHDMVSAYKVADRIAMLYEGQIVGSGTPDEIKTTTNAVVHQFITGASKGPITDNHNSN
ncbi:MAG: ABC transporter ATP-binding protein [Candidatus Omnitrophica bacterium]|nr:ABC transporter ATP-binding protein [Candidatus Omnitrophota bacterium]